MAERKRLPAFLVLAVVLVATAAVVLDYWGYVMSATHTVAEVQITGFTSHDSVLYLKFRYTNPRGVKVVVLETPYSVMLNGVVLATDAVPGPIVVEGAEPAYAERALTLPTGSSANLEAARASREWDWEIKGTMRLDTVLGDARVDFSETISYVPLLAN